MHVITQDGILWRTLPCPILPGQRHKLQGVRLAGPDPLPQTRLTIQRRVSSRGGIQVARQRIQVGMTHAGKTVTIELCDTTLRVIDQHGELITTVPRNGTGRDQQVQGLRPADIQPEHGSNHGRYQEDGDLMTGVILNATDAAELAEMLQFLADWLQRDPGRLSASMEDFVGHPAYNHQLAARRPGQVHLLLGGSDGEPLFGSPQ